MNERTKPQGNGGGKEDRTPGLWNANPTLYHLSYTPTQRKLDQIDLVNLDCIIFF